MASLNSIKRLAYIQSTPLSGKSRAEPLLIFLLRTEGHHATGTVTRSIRHRNKARNFKGYSDARSTASQWGKYGKPISRSGQRGQIAIAWPAR